MDRLTVTSTSKLYGDGKLRVSDTTTFSPSSVDAVIGTDKVASTATDENKNSLIYYSFVKLYSVYIPELMIVTVAEPILPILPMLGDASERKNDSSSSNSVSSFNRMLAHRVSTDVDSEGKIRVVGRVGLML